MSVVVSDTSPLHYLILCGEEKVLARLFDRVLIPPTVFRELQQSNTPAPVREWAKALPQWCAVQSPAKTDLAVNIDPGELEALCLAKEVKAVERRGISLCSPRLCVEISPCLRPKPSARS